MSVAATPAAFCVWPTAVHVWLAPHDTPFRRFGTVADRLGVGCRVHALPFQISASVRNGVCLLAWESPTAVQASAEVHDTLLRVLVWNPEGLGVGCTVHVDPFQTSARVSGLPW